MKDGVYMNVLHQEHQAAGIVNASLTGSQMERYSRQILLPEFGVEGQKRLFNAKVAIVGAGGLGAPASIYLAAAGVGTIGLIDADHVDRSNLQRQILHFESDVGQPKTVSGKQHLQEINTDVIVNEHHVRLSAENVMEIFEQYDVIVNGSDNFPTRYLANDACYLLGKPLVDASILKWEGNLHVFQPGCGCYRCMYPEPPKPGTVPSCSEAGVIGAIAGVMGSMQAMETIKIILGLDNVLSNRSILMNLLTGSTRTIKRGPRKDCPLCGEHATIKELIDYEQFCGIPSLNKYKKKTGTTLLLHELRIDDVVKWMQEKPLTLVDVRKKKEYDHAHIEGSLSIDLNQLSSRIGELNKDETIICICDVGLISTTAVSILREQGFNHVYSLIGGLLEWENRGLPICR